MAGSPLQVDLPRRARRALAEIHHRAGRVVWLNPLLGSPGYEPLITHLFQKGAEYLDSDVVFGTKRRQGMVETMAKQAARTMGSQVGRQILRGVLGGIFGKRR